MLDSSTDPYATKHTMEKNQQTKCECETNYIAFIKQSKAKVLCGLPGTETSAHNIRNLLSTGINMDWTFCEF